MRRYSTTVYGNNAAELEEAAFAKARIVFGNQIGLAIDRSYGIFENSSYMSENNAEAANTLFHASVDVHPDEGLTGNEWYPGKTGGHGSEGWSTARHELAYQNKYEPLDFGLGIR